VGMEQSPAAGRHALNESLFRFIVRLTGDG
jgi:hypothetical protein